MTGDALDLQVLAAQLRRGAEDLSLYGGMLLTVLAAALPPDLVEVRRESSWRARLAGREPAVLGVSVTLGPWRYDLDRPGVGALPATAMRHQSGGVVMSNRTVGIEEWCRALAAGLAQVAGTNEAALGALRRLTTG
jgi:hypothetical protein